MSNKIEKGQKRLNLIKGQLASLNALLTKNKTILDGNDKNIWTGFYKKPVFERITQISKIFKDIDIEKLKSGGLTLIRADSMVENCIGLINLPVGLG
jgi:hydroxymethylglutaryl-CoA reductase